MSVLLVEVRPSESGSEFVASIANLDSLRGRGRTVADALRELAKSYEAFRDNLVALDEALR